MAFELTPGNALACRTNSHRHGWDGSICRAAASWNCGADQTFREDYCERGDDRCFHLNLFSEETPELVVHESGAAWILDHVPNALDNQIILLGGPIFSEPVGIAENRRGENRVYGIYRIERVDTRTMGRWRNYVMRPHHDGWARLEELRLPMPYAQNAGGPYMRQIERADVDRLMRDALAAGEREWGDRPKDLARVRSFADNLERWLDQAKTHTENLQPPEPKEAATFGPETKNRPFLKLQQELMSRVVEPAPPSRVILIPPEPVVAPVVAPLRPTSEPIVEEARRVKVERRFGRAVLDALQVGSLTKPLLVLRGEAGVGKSTLALNLIDDPLRERTLVVPVGSTWRGREDLIGYVNPIDGVFQATAFTRFLFAAATAWEAGDRRTRLLIFEEFNLSQPEHWLSDILVRSQFPAEFRIERTIELGGTSIHGLPNASPEGVYLAPSVRIVATVNTDFTTRPLSPRILDRAAVIPLSIEPREALERVSVQLPEDMVEAVVRLSQEISAKGASFSYRTALSLGACLAQADALGLAPWGALDLVLLQEVLTKVRLLSGDPLDSKIIRRLIGWSEEHGSRLPRCTVTIAGWKEHLESGQDVVQL